jgi:hypothetical protein
LEIIMLIDEVGQGALRVPLAPTDPSELSPELRAARRTRLRQIHLQMSVDPRYLTLPPGASLWFVSLLLDLEVHAGCLGFTRHLYEYAIGETEAEAIEAVRKYRAKACPDAEMLSCSARHSSCEHPEELCCPDQVRRLDIARPSANGGAR